MTWMEICGAWWLSGRVRYLASGGSQVQIPLWPPRRDLGQVLYSQLPVVLRRVSSDTVSMLQSRALLKGSHCEKRYINTIQYYSHDYWY